MELVISVFRTCVQKLEITSIFMEKTENVTKKNIDFLKNIRYTVGIGSKMVVKWSKMEWR